LNNLRWRRALSLKGKLEVADDLVNDRMIFDEGDDAHLAPLLHTLGVT